jgi:hypothetical protein
VTANPIRVKQGFIPRALIVLSYFVLLGGLLTIGFCAYMVVIGYSVLPYWDGWIQIEYATQHARPGLLDWLWAQHNEHRILIPKLFLLADLYLFAASQELLLVSIFGVQLLHLGLLSWSMRVLGGWRGPVWRTGVGLAAFCLFCPSQWENFVWGFQTCFVLPGLFATLSFIGLLLYWTRSQAEYLVLCILAAFGATYSLSNGNLLWPLLVMTALLIPLRLPVVVSLVAAGTVSTFLYLYDYLPTHAMLTRATMRVTLQYLAVYLGSAWVRGNVQLAGTLGLVGLAVALFLLLRVRRYVEVGRAFSIQLVLTLLFCIGTGLITALGRAGLGLSHAFTSRYQTVALLFWCCLGLILLAFDSSVKGCREVALLLTQLALLSIMSFAAHSGQTPLIHARVHRFQQNAAAMALAAGVADLNQLHWVSPDPQDVLSLAPSMREQHLSVFSGGAASFLGKPLSSVVKLAPSGACTGHVESAIGIDAAGQRSLKLTGWAWDNQHRQAPAQIAATINGVITGLGAVGDWRPTARETNPGITSDYTGFTGYIGDVWESIPVNIYAILSDRPATACLIVTITDVSHLAQ